MMLATVQIRLRSSGPGSSASGFRCSRIPTGRCSRKACWAAATDFDRPTVIGKTTPGNRTVLRTGTMISASLGIGTESAWPAAVDEAGLSELTGDIITSHRLRQTQRDASIYREAADRVSPGGQQNASFESALRKLKAMNPGVAQLDRQHPVTTDDKRPVFDYGLDLIRVHAGQRDQNEYFLVRFQHVDR